MRTPPLLALFLFALSLPVTRTVAAEPAVKVTTGQDYNGWKDAIVLRNSVVEAVIVPSVGRVMQFRFVGETDGPFWANEKLVGKAMPPNPWATIPGSFGGDKTWPAPQSLWNWPPPDVFDTAALTARVNADQSVTLESPVSPRFGIRTVRRVSLDPKTSVMQIETTYEKISGDPLGVSIWVISQLRDPAGIFVPLPVTSKFPDGLAPQRGSTAFVGRENGWLRLTRDARVQRKIASDASTLVWAGETQLLRIDLPRIAEATYPETGYSVVVYTNPDPVPYVELETFGPMKTLNPGDKMSATNTYRLAHRTKAPLETDVKALLAP